MHRRLTAIAAAGGILLLTLTGCSGDPVGTGADAGGAVKLAANEVLAQVSDKAGQADTFRMKMTANPKIAQPGVPADLSAEMDMVIRLRPAYAAKTSMVFKGSDPDLAGSRSMQVIVVDDAAYMNAGDPSLTGGRPWGRLPLKDLAGVTGTDLTKQAQQQSPAEAARILTAARNVKETGKEVVDGVQTTRYEGTLDIQRDLAKLNPEYSKQMTEQFKELGPAVMEMKLWVGTDGLPRKQTSEITARFGLITTTVFYSDYGKPVQISAPPADQVGEFSLPDLPRTPTRT